MFLLFSTTQEILENTLFQKELILFTLSKYQMCLTSHPMLWQACCHCTSLTQILHQGKYCTKLNSKVPFSYKPHSPCRGDFGGLKISLHLFAHMPICYIFSTALRKDLLFWLLALSLCSGRTKPTQHLYLRTDCSFKYNFHSNTEIHILVMTAQKLKDFPYLEHGTFIF